MQESKTDVKQRPFSWFTVEVGLYGLILAVALALRLVGLGRGVMDEREAAQAWQAWRLVNAYVADGASATESSSLLLLTAQVVLFALFGASDVTARLFPALVGGLAVLLPALLRQQLGRWGALAASLILALSPTLVYTARYADGGGLLAAFLLAVVVLVLAWARDERPIYLWALAICGACALLADPRVISVALALGVAWAAKWWMFRYDLFAESVPKMDWKRLATIGAATLVLLATTGALNPRGLGIWADFPARWVAHLQPVVNGQSWAYPLAALVIYEPLLLLLGLIGAVVLVVQRSELSILTWLALALLLLALLSGGRNPADVGLICVVLALPAGAWVEMQTADWRRGRLVREGAFIGVALVLGTYLTLESAMFASALYRQLESIGFFWLWLLAVVLVLVLLILYVLWFGMASMWRALSATLALVLLLVTLGVSVRLNFEHINDPKELHIRTAPYVGVRDALQTLKKLAWQQAGYPTSASVVVQAQAGPIWRWYLRDWERVKFVDALSSQVRAPLMLTLATGDFSVLGEQYSGQDFVVRKWWSPEFLDATDWLTWWLYAKSSTYAVKLDSVILWTRMDSK